MDLDEIFEKEMIALEDQLDRGEITKEKFDREVRYLRNDLDEQQYIQDMRDAGRGYLLG